VDFATEIKPILEESCIRCHGPAKQDNDFRVDDPDLVMGYVSAGDSEGSDIYQRLVSDDEEFMMPPPGEGGPLDSSRIDRIRRWIDEGAVWPETVSIEMPAEAVASRVAQELAADERAQDRRDSLWQLVWEAAGLLHPSLVHFPVALLIGGALFALFGMRGESPLSDAAYYCLWLGAWSSILAGVSGWSFAIEKSYLDWNRSFDMARDIDVHRWGGVLVTVLAFLLSLYASGSRRRDPYGSGALWKLSLIVLACLAGYVSYRGGHMTHVGLHDELSWKSQLIYEKITGNDADREPADGEGVDDVDPGAPPVGTGETTEGDAKTSGEDGGETVPDVPDDEGASDAGEPADDGEGADGDGGQPDARPSSNSGNAAPAPTDPGSGNAPANDTPPPDDDGGDLKRIA
jgi:uncharacterized membrane protein